MNNERVGEEIVTKFLLNTCRLRPKLTRPAVQAAAVCGLIAAKKPTNPDDDVDTELIPLITGSVAEFYIEPMVPHVGDIDIMYHLSTKLAIPRGHPPPTQLPDEFNNYVQVYEIVDSHFPGYVFLVLRYLLTECVDDGKYNAIEYDRHAWCLSNSSNWLCDDSGKFTVDIHGPAIQTVVKHHQAVTVHATDQVSSLDEVTCVRCLVWPPQAADWPTRHRNYGWPNSATVDCVVSNGCDVVGVAHRQYRQNEWVRQHQHRLSFSRAEIVLINSWMPVQQIVYHMLRVFMKSERLTDGADNSGVGKLSNYHIKTLMLWACEMKPKSWWTDNLNLVRFCVQLLHTLADWLTDARCQHYFINNCNLIDNSFNGANIGSQLMSVNKTRLSKWFVDSYIRKCSQLCPDNIFRLYDAANTSTKLQNAVWDIVAWRLSNPLLDSWYVFVRSEHIILSAPNTRPLTARSCVCWMTEMAKIYPPLSDYFTAVASLHIAARASRHGLNDELTDILATLFGQFTSRRRYSSSLLLDTAAKLMKVVANKSLSTVQLIDSELSKAYLYRALR